MLHNRIDYIDSMKGIAIVLMVMGHVIAWNYADYSNIVIISSNQSSAIKAGGLVWQFIYSFHMALFFMVSGFLSYKEGVLPSLLVFLKKKSKRLLIPWMATFGIAYMLRGDYGYWFLLSLFEVSIVGYMIIFMSNILKIKNIFLDVVIIVVVWLLLRNISEVNLCGVEVGRFVNDLLPFCVGILLSKYANFYKVCCESELFLVVLILLYVVLFSSQYLQGLGAGFALVSRYSSLLLHISAPLIVWHICANCHYNQFFEVLIYLGKKTMPIYILHMAFVIQIPSIGEFILEQNFTTSITIQLTYSLLFSFIAIFWSLIVYKIINKSRTLSGLFFGES